MYVLVSFCLLAVLTDIDFSAREIIKIVIMKFKVNSYFELQGRSRSVQLSNSCVFCNCFSQRNSLTICPWVSERVNQLQSMHCITTL